VIETVLGSRIALSPFIINKGKGHYLGWYRTLTEAELTYHFSYCPKGWTDNKLAMRSLYNLFDLESALIVGVNQPRLLILDGHSSYNSFKFIQYCIESGIHPPYLLTRSLNPSTTAFRCRFIFTLSTFLWVGSP